MARIILPRNMEVVVASFGGVGTTFLISYIEQYKKINHYDDEDGIKHLPLPPVSFNKNVKFVYVYGNPQLAAISLFRRDYHYLQSKKLQKCVRTHRPPIPLEMTLQEYASQGIDKFHFREQFYNWHDKYLSSSPTLFIRYETLFDNIEPLLEFLDLPGDCIEGFPKKRKRSSAIDDIPVVTRKQLDLMYGDFSDELAQLADVEIRKRTNRNFREMPYLKSPYLKAYIGQAAFESKELLRKYTPQLYTLLRKLK